MSDEETRAREEFGALSGCFVEGDSEQRRRERRVKRRALALSISLQALALAAVILLPLFGTTERISLAVSTPMPPYYHRSAAPIQQNPSRDFPTIRHDFTISYPSANAPTQPTQSQTEGPAEPFLPGAPPTGDRGFACTVGCVDLRGENTRPVPPPPHDDRPKVVHVTNLDPAMLIRRVEPIYPRLAIQTRREGVVQLHAIVGTDGTIQSLQVLSGDPFLVPSAKEAVLQWRYKPTYLNGQAVEVDTTIIVTYTLTH